MGMNVGKIMAFAEFSQPAGDTVRIRHSSIIMGEDEVGTDPAITIENSEPKLFCVPFVFLCKKADFCYNIQADVQVENDEPDF